MSYFKDLIARAKRGIVVEVANITPATALEMLDRNPDNRPISAKTVAKLASDMQAGLWATNGESIVISKEGLLNDGQHRLRAVAESGVAIDSVVTAGVARETRLTVDQGLIRSAGSILAISGVPYYNEMARAARLSLMFERVNGEGLGREQISSSATVRRAMNDTRIVDAVNYATSFNRKTLPMTMSQLAFWRWLCGNDERKVAFLTQMASGEMIAHTDNAYIARARIMREKPSDKLRTEIFMRGLLAELNGESLARMRVTGKFPKIEGIN